MNRNVFAKILTATDARTKGVVFTALLIFLGRLGTVAGVVVTIPWVRSSLDPELFGVWMFMSSLIGFFGFADLGVGNAILGTLSADRAIGDARRARRTITGGYVGSGLVCVCIVTLWALFCCIVGDPTIIVGVLEERHRGQTTQALHLLFGLLAISFPIGLIQKIQLSAQKGHWIGVTQLLASLLSVAATMISIKLGAQVPALVLSSLGVAVLVNLGSTFLWMLCQYPEEKPRWNSIDFRVTVELFKGGSLFLVLQLASAFAYQSDGLVITQRLGASMFGDYAILRRLYSFSSIIVSAGLAGLWPAFAEALVKKEVEWARVALARAGVSACLASLVLSLAVTASLHFFQFGFAGSHDPSLSILFLLSFWSLTEAMGMVAGTFLNSAGALKGQAAAAICMGAVAFGGKWFLVGLFGVEGAIVATICSYWFISIPVIVLMLRGVLLDARQERLSPQGCL